MLGSIVNLLTQASLLQPPAPDPSRPLLKILGLLNPELALAAFACVVFLGGTFVAKKGLWGFVALAGFVAAFYLAMHGLDGPLGQDIFIAPIVIDSFATFIRYVALVSGMILLMLSWHELPDRHAADHHACLLILIAGLSLVGSANDLVTLFLALELISIPTYIMLYLPRHDRASQEASLKYFLLSIFSSAMLLFGFSYLYGIVGSTNLAVILDTLNSHAGRNEMPAATMIALVTIISGLSFRLTAVPFHFYAPDVYQGTANVSAALLAYVPKVAGAVGLLKILGFVIPGGVSSAVAASPLKMIGVGLSDQVPLVFWILAVATMFIGNLMALRQEHVRRLLAYSSIAHAGYILVALAAAPYLRAVSNGPDGVEAVLYYLLAYGAMTVGAFGILAYLDGDDRRIDTLDDLAGLSKEHPRLAISLAIFLFSMVGIPFTAGFTGKFFIVFSALAMQEQHAVLYRVLAVIMMLNAALGGWYYLRIVAALYFRNPIKPFPIRRSLPALATITACLLLTVGMSLPPVLPILQKMIKVAASNPSTAIAHK